jgi:DNA primase large subunit
LQSSIWNNLHPNQVLGQPAVIKEMDCLTATIEEIREVRAQVSLPINRDRTRVAALAGWFDVHFRVCRAELLPSSPHFRFTFYSTVDAHRFAETLSG